MTRFRVRRTSGHYRDEFAPCEEAEPAKFPRWDRRTFRSEAEADQKFGRGWWRSEGADHRPSTTGGIERRMSDEEGWAVDISDLPSLLAFIDKYGEVVLSPPESEGDSLMLEIYDGYRE